MNWKLIESAPKDATRILVFFGDILDDRGCGIIGSKRVAIIYWGGWGGGIWTADSGHSGGISEEPTHWMPLPEVPTATQGGA